MCWSVFASCQPSQYPFRFCWVDVSRPSNDRDTCSSPEKINTCNSSSSYTGITNTSLATKTKCIAEENLRTGYLAITTLSKNILSDSSTQSYVSRVLQMKTAIKRPEMASEFSRPSESQGSSEWRTAMVIFTEAILRLVSTLIIILLHMNQQKPVILSDAEVIRFAVGVPWFCRQPRKLILKALIQEIVKCVAECNREQKKDDENWQVRRGVMHGLLAGGPKATCNALDELSSGIHSTTEAPRGHSRF